MGRQPYVNLSYRATVQMRSALLWLVVRTVNSLPAETVGTCAKKSHEKQTGDNWAGSHPAAARSLQSCPTLCDPIDGSPPGSPVPGILQARTLEWVAISFSSA